MLPVSLRRGVSPGAVQCTEAFPWYPKWRLYGKAHWNGKKTGGPHGNWKPSNMIVFAKPPMKSNELLRCFCCLRVLMLFIPSVLISGMIFDASEKQIWGILRDLWFHRNGSLQLKLDGNVHQAGGNTSCLSVFSRMRSKGSRFTLGVCGGWGCVRSTLRLWSQPFATVRNRPRDPRMAVPMGSSAEVVIFGGFRRVVASFRVAGVALRDIQTCSGTCRKSFCVAGAILLRRFQKMCCSFRGRRSTLDVSIVIFRGRRSTLDVSCCVFFANRIGRAASSGDKVQIPWQAWHFLRCVENGRKPRTKHRFWGCQFSRSKENS